MAQDGDGGGIFDIVSSGDYFDVGGIEQTYGDDLGFEFVEFIWVGDAFGSVTGCGMAAAGFDVRDRGDGGDDGVSLLGAVQF